MYRGKIHYAGIARLISGWGGYLFLCFLGPRTECAISIHPALCFCQTVIMRMGFRRQRLPRGAMHGDGVGHDKSVGVHLALYVTEDVVIQLQLLQVRPAPRFVESAAFQRNPYEIARDTVLHFTPSLGFDFLPEAPLEAFAASRILPVAAAWMFAPNGAADISKTADMTRKIARRFFMGRILTAV